jgi:ADP-heptose:LPS heptosyltransferase
MLRHRRATLEGLEILERHAAGSSGIVAALKGLHYRARCRLDLALTRLRGRRQCQASIHPAEVSSVLVCRINGRLGNTLLLTAMLRHLHELLPHATIDVAIAYADARELIADMPGVRRVVLFPHRGPRLIRRYLRALRSLRSCHYDLVIDPIPASTSNRIALTLCRARARAGFAGESQWAPLTHAVAVPHEIVHHAVQPVFMVSRVLNGSQDLGGVRLWLPLSTEQKSAGRAAIAHALGARAGDLSHVCGFFAHASGHKALGRTWWRAFWRAFLALEPDAMPVEFLQPGASTPIDATFAHVQFSSLRAMAGAIAATRMFISADTGPMHLACCTPVPTVGLFRASRLDLYRPLKPGDFAIEVAHRSPQEVAESVSALWRNSREQACECASLSIGERAPETADQLPAAGQKPASGL